MDNDEESQSATQGQLFDPKTVTMRKADPVASVVNSLSSYSGGKWSGEGLENVMAKGPEGFAVYKMHERNMTEPPTPETIKSYEVMREHIGRQFDHLTRPESEGGAGINVEVVDENPYDTFEEMHADVTGPNRRMKILSTRSTAPPETPDKGHSFFTNEQNNRSRAVHDFMHVALGRGFDRNSEEAVVQGHLRAFPKAAHAAVASEFRGQNSYLNWGGNDFPPNVMVNTPEWAAKEKVKIPVPKRKVIPQSEPQQFDI